MKKIVVITVCILLIALCAAPIYEAAAAPATGGVIYLLNPTAIAAVGDRLFVADNIQSGTTAILCFDVSGASPIFLYDHTISGDVVRLSAKSDTGLYATFAQRVIEYATAADSLQEAHVYNVSNAVNFTQGTYIGEPAEYYADAERVYLSTDGTFDSTGGTFAKVTDIVSIGNYIYVLHTNERGATDCIRLQNALRPGGDVFNSAATTDKTEEGAIGLFTLRGDADMLGYYTADALHTVEIASASCHVLDLLEHDNATNGEVRDVTTTDDAIYILNEQHRIEQYRRSAEGYTPSAGIGTETLPGNVPTAYTSYTLVQSSGYPSNIVFMTEGARSIERLIDNAEQYIVLGYDGDAESEFYYVLIGDRFGWVRKSVGASDPEHDPKLNVISTAVGSEGLEYRTRFASLNAVYIAPLPSGTFLDEQYVTTFTQSAGSAQNVTALQRFSEGDTTWYLVRYDGTRTGFVRAQYLGKFYLHTATEGGTVAALGQRKINTRLFGTVHIYAFGDPAYMTEEYEAVDSQGNRVKLHSGRRVTLLENLDNGLSLVQIDFGDGTNAQGYVETDRLIPTTALTTNAIFGVTTTCIALALAAILTVVFVKRARRLKSESTN